MTVRISQEDDHECGLTRLRVEGSLCFADAQMLADLCRELREQPSRRLVIDLAGVTFLDDESARLLRRLKSPEIILAGLQLFTERMIERPED
ncbi:MAG: STAS domain-containing protein [Blastocatellia bacterium]